MIKLTNTLGNPVIINPDKIQCMQVCDTNEWDQYDAQNDGSETELVVRIFFNCKDSLIVRECLNEIVDRINLQKAISNA